MADAHECSTSGLDFSKERNAPRARRKKLLSADYTIKKRQPFDLKKKRDKDVFITNKTNFKAQLKICEKLFNNGAGEVIIHGLGAAVHRACSLALQLKEIHYSGIDFDIKTSTTPIIDDFEPLQDNADYETINRNNSAIHIRVFRKFSIGSLKYQE
ncbi:PREDICTED: ribonuclease P protein subunit p20 [Dufourea novaeangliae]|uniref:Ribonuclease P protein subunit p20 n=1 Tax=Dufourea novaeangliae TaxID=178035 RepID=A0A154P9V6_DUFNO|nr:PREDICTED: ribonuclease P protein subunit p20 [Dufourea novaeangliae]KZC08716.1 Ribonuclease P protein subunit p20 [Dufourea novaeangliae]